MSGAWWYRRIDSCLLEASLPGGRGVPASPRPTATRRHDQASTDIAPTSMAPRAADSRRGRTLISLKDAFNPRSNSIGFLRWALAFVVIFSHAGPLGGFYGGQSLGNQWTDQQSFGGVAVAGFFFLSGFLITKSRMGRRTVFRFFWRRSLRIFPAFWAALLFTAFVLAPIAFWHVN